MDIATWLQTAAAELGLDAELGHAEIRQLLDVARDAAHAIERPAAPLTTFLLGLAVGRGAELAPSVESIATLATRVAGQPEPGPSASG